MVRRDYYEVLQVSRQASSDEIKTSYRRLARIYHPDLADEHTPDAEEAFKLIAEAWRVLGNEQRRAAYDQYGHASMAMRHPPLRRPSSNPVVTVVRTVAATAARAMKASAGADIQLAVEVDFLAAARGFERVFELPRCADDDPDGLHPRMRRISFTFPTGVTDGQVLRWAREGTPGRFGGRDGALDVTVRVRPHEVFQRSGDDIRCALPLSLLEMEDGTSLEAPGIHGPVVVDVPAGTRPGDELRVAAAGIRRQSGTCGDAVFVVQMAWPGRLSEEQRAAVRALDSVIPAKESALRRRLDRLTHSLILLLSLLVLSSQPRQAWAQQQDPPPHVAFLAPLSGPNQNIGQRAHRAVVMAVEAWPGAIEVRAYDTGGDPVAAATSAMNAGAIAILGPIGELESRAVVAAVGDAGTPVYLLSSVDGLETLGSNVFRLVTSVADQARALAAVEISAHAGASYAVIASDDAFGGEAAAAFVQAVVAEGGQVTDVVRYPADDLDGTTVTETLSGELRPAVVASTAWSRPPVARPQRASVTMPRPDAIFIADYAANVADLLPFLQFAGFITEDSQRSVRLLGPSSWLGGQLRLAGDLAAGANVVATYYIRDSRGPSEAFTLAYQDRWGADPSAFEAEVFDAAGFLLSALQSSAALAMAPAEVIRRVDSAPIFGGACGRLVLTGDGGVERELGMWEIDGGGNAFPLGLITPPELRSGR